MTDAQAIWHDSENMPPSMRHVGYVIRRLLGLHNVQPAHLAEYIGTRRTHIAAIMGGRQGIEKSNAVRIAGAFAIPVDCLSFPDPLLALRYAVLTAPIAPVLAYVPEGREEAHFLRRRQEAADATGEAMRAFLNPASQTFRDLTDGVAKVERLTLAADAFPSASV